MPHLRYLIGMYLVRRGWAKNIVHLFEGLIRRVLMAGVRDGWTVALRGASDRIKMPREGLDCISESNGWQRWSEGHVAFLVGRDAQE